MDKPNPSNSNNRSNEENQDQELDPSNQESGQSTPGESSATGQVFEVKPLTLEQQRQHQRITITRFRREPRLTHTSWGYQPLPPYWLRSNASRRLKIPPGNQEPPSKVARTTQGSPRVPQVTTSDASSQTDPPSYLQQTTTTVRWYLWVPKLPDHPSRES